MNEEQQIKQSETSEETPPPFRIIDEWVKRDEGANLQSFLSRHKVLVVLMKRLIIALAVILVIAVMVWPFLGPEEKRFQIVFSSVGDKVAKVADETNAMLKPRFQGVDKNNQPYNVIAAEAVQQDEDTVLLKRVIGDITLNDKRWYAISANEGVIKIKSKQMDLQDNVSVFTDSGFEVHTSSAHADMEAGMAWGEDDVMVQGPPGSLEATGFKIIERGDEIYFTGPVRMTIYTGRK